MTVFNNINFKNLDEFAEWLNDLNNQNFPPWDEWFGHKYCDTCVPIVKSNGHRECEYAWCELNGDKCKYFQDMDEIPWGKQVIKMWLESEDNDGVQDESC